MKTTELIAKLVELDRTGERNVNIVEYHYGGKDKKNDITGVLPDGARTAIVISEFNESVETTRQMGCSECGNDLPYGTPFVHHETDGSWGGPWCMRCAIEKFDFGRANLEDNFIYHPPQEK